MTVSVCTRCGTIAKSGKPSCCGRGGSWFKSCRSGEKHTYTWHGGIQTCKSQAQSKRAHDRQSNAAQRLKSSSGVETENVRAATTAKVFSFISGNTSIPIPLRMQSIAPHESAATSEGTFVAYDATNANSERILTPDASLVDERTTISLIAATHTSSLATMDTNAISPTIAITTMITRSDKETQISVDQISQGVHIIHEIYLNYLCYVFRTLHLPSLASRCGPHADSVVVGITVGCIVFLILITLISAGCHYFHKSTKK